MSYHIYGFYTCGNSLLSKAVLLQNYGTLKYTGNEVTHSGLILEPDKALITPDSLVFESTLKYGGVRFTTLKSIIHRNANLIITEYNEPITLGQYDAMLDVAHKLEGLPYDLKGIIGLAAHEDWQEEDMFFCSEAKAFAMKNGAKYKGVNWDKYKLSRITPKINRSWQQTQLRLDGNGRVI